MKRYWTIECHTVEAGFTIPSENGAHKVNVPGAEYGIIEPQRTVAKIGLEKTDLPVAELAAREIAIAVLKYRPDESHRCIAELGFMKNSRSGKNKSAEIDTRVPDMRRRQVASKIEALKINIPALMRRRPTIPSGFSLQP